MSHPPGLGASPQPARSARMSFGLLARFISAPSMSSAGGLSRLGFKNVSTDVRKIVFEGIDGWREWVAGLRPGDSAAPREWLDKNDQATRDIDPAESEDRDLVAVRRCGQ